MRYLALALILSGCGLYFGPDDPTGGGEGPDARVAADAGMPDGHRATPDARPDAAPSPSPDAAMVGCAATCDPTGEIYCRPDEPSTCWCLPAYVACLPTCTVNGPIPCACGASRCETASTAETCAIYGTACR